MEEKTKAPAFDECSASSCCNESIARNFFSLTYPTKEPEQLQQELDAEIESKFTPKKIRSLSLVDKYQDISQDNLSVDSDGCIVSTSVSRKYSRKASRVRSCGSYLEFHQYPDKNRLHQANFCKDRLCPMCNWRRSLKIFSQLSETIEALKSSPEYSDCQFLFLTLTIRNVFPEELSSALSALLSGWRKLYHKSLVFKSGSMIEGSFRSIEITYNESTNTFHPHLHVILAVRPSYFQGKFYIPQKRWSELWQQCMNLDYSPIVDIRKTYSKISRISASEISSVTAAITEASKYATKDTDYLDYDSEITRVLSEALEGVRLIGYTGCFSKIRKSLKHDDAEDGDLVHTSSDDIQPEVVYAVIRLSWVNGFYKRT